MGVGIEGDMAKYSSHFHTDCAKPCKSEFDPQDVLVNINDHGRQYKRVRWATWAPLRL